MSDKINRDEIDLNLDLSLGIPQDPVKKQRHGQFMQLLRSDLPQNIQPSPPPQHYMTYPVDFPNVIIPSNVPIPALPPYPAPPSVLEAAPLPNQPLGQFLHPAQPIQVENGALEARRVGRPPKGQARRNSSKAGAVENDVGDKEIVPRYPWATKKPAVLQTVKDLCQKDITEISGQVYCRSCDTTQTLRYDLVKKFKELSAFIKENIEEMRNRAPTMWTTPKLILCETCESGMKPVISEKKEEINWLFLLLGQMLGCCTLEQLRFFCESTSQHRTGSKDHVLYSTYLGLFKQLEPDEKS